MQKIKQLDGLRGLLALSLVFFHFSPKGTFVTDNFMVRHADLFVDFFFVLSGFVIALNYQEKIIDGPSFKSYLIKRFARIYPLLFYTVLLEFIIQLVVNNAYAHVLQRPKSNGLLTTMFFKSLLLFNGTPVMGKINGINEPTWSISAEAISYLVFGAAVFYYKKYIVPIALAIVLICLCFFLYIGRFVVVDDFGFIRGLFGFHLGVLAYRVAGKFSRVGLFTEVVYVLLLVLGFYAIDWVGIDLFKMIFPFYFAAGVVLFANGGGFITDLLNSKPLQFLGRISYSVYLNHILILYLVYTFVFRILKWEISLSHTLMSVILYALIVLVYSALTFRFIEKWGNKYFKGKLKGKLLKREK